MQLKAGSANALLVNPFAFLHGERVLRLIETYSVTHFVEIALLRGQRTMTQKRTLGDGLIRQYFFKV